MTSVLTNAVFAGISGSAVTDATGIGKVVIPWTRRLGYSGGYATAVNASASGASVAAVFTAGIGPGIFAAVLLLIGCWLVAWKAGFPRVRAEFTAKRLLIDLLFATPAILLLTPVMLPVAHAIEMDMIHFGILMVVTLAVGLYTPPVGTTLFISASIGRVPILETARALLPFYGLGLIVVLLVAYAPGPLFVA